MGVVAAVSDFAEGAQTRPLGKKLLTSSEGTTALVGHLPKKSDVTVSFPRNQVAVRHSFTRQAFTQEET